ncbi:SCP2 sterol-binding domain-containing protein [Salinispora arenicola]|uniref:SCP2 domain-containing protein n=1 Tax=Salinispora arenicola (strain CNS-205) TaxID=391037 RepID=A8LVU0_SALAI|nr:SCP2 sterol-binding domain-containing protein [Salinispora arenicola]MCN0178085.1 SCP2 sterol-binding domain-containing protein [Salinispora arenicola]NIL57481.1 SCP2 sterol-binding domain-containing protein [Salinispora arenicola]NIL61416.1 SCP2 sterol-binding domain-containing protein [Salinispora arenicola]
MTTPAAKLIGRLESGRHPELPETTAGTVRLDVREDGRTEHWHLTIADQRVRVHRCADEADLVLRADRAVFDRIAAGALHPAAALGRNDLTVHGDIRLFTMLRRLFPGPPGARHPRDAARPKRVSGTSASGRSAHSAGRHR